MFAADTTPEFEIGTVATHTCNTAFALVGGMTRTCTDDDQADIVGVWSGRPPTCECKGYLFIGYFKEKNDFAGNVSNSVYHLLYSQQSSVRP